MKRRKYLLGCSIAAVLMLIAIKFSWAITDIPQEEVVYACYQHTGYTYIKCTPGTRSCTPTKCTPPQE